MKLLLRKPSAFGIALCFFVVCINGIVNAQCNNWWVTSNVATASSCTANGNFTLSIAGPDAANITNLQYGIPLNANGFSVPLNSSPTFSNMPAGGFLVSVLGSCGGNIVGKNRTVIVPGTYTPLSVTAALGRSSLACGNYGIIGVSISAGRAPFTVTLTAVPTSYTGPVSFTANGSMGITKLNPGAYTIQVVDACGSGSSPTTITVPSLASSSVSFISPTTRPAMINCNTVNVQMPIISSLGWLSYQADTLFKVAVQISNGVSAQTPFKPLNSGSFNIPLAPGKTIKDCYGKTITYTIQHPCGGTLTVTDYFPTPYFTSYIVQHCNVNFDADLSLTGMICMPVTFSVRNSSTGISYGPYVSNNGTSTAMSLPIGSYTVSYTTGDGYTGQGTIGTLPVSGNPYSVNVLDGSYGLHNYIRGFQFITSNVTIGNKYVELFSGPAGYAFQGYWSGGNSYLAIVNQYAGANNLLFPAGNYVWKITDDCGTYLLPVTVKASDLYQYTVSIRDSLEVCAGKWIFPVGTATNNGTNQPFKFKVLLNGFPYNPQPNVPWPTYNANDGVLLTISGVYTILPFSGTDVYRLLYPVLYPNVYTRTVNFVYNAEPAKVDINKTQGFLCLNGTVSDGKIVVAGTGGIPFRYPAPHYYYELGFAGSGTFFANNTTGYFSGFGALPNALYDVRVTDSCGAFSTQQVKILDLRNARLISSSRYVTCAGDSVQLSTIYLPNATYLWSGPNGFTSTLRSPVVRNINPSNIGVYNVTINTTECSMLLKDSTIIAMNGNPPKPSIGLTCLPAPGLLTVINPLAGYNYQWLLGVLSSRNYYTVVRSSDTANSFYPMYGRASYRAIAVDTNTGCRSYSDSIYLAADPVDSLDMTIYSPHLNLCTGDTTILVAQEPGALNYQWFKNGIVIPGATSQSYTTNIPGNYKVRVETGICNTDTSDEVTVTVVQPPGAAITATATQMCPGDTVFIQANIGTSYTYNWLLNGSSIPGEFSPSLSVTQTGNYAVIISNGACARTSAAIPITLLPGPQVNLTPATNQRICPGDSVNFSTSYDASYTYTWKVNNTVIPGANSNRFTARAAGAYQVIVGNALCPNVTSVTVSVQVAAAGINLGNDTTICIPGSFSIPLSIDTSFSQVAWSTGESTNRINVTTGGRYWVRGVNACGTYTDTINVTTITDYLPNLADDTLVCNVDNRLVLSVPIRLQNIQWSTGATTSFLVITDPGIYWVTATSPCGTLTDTIRVRFCSPEIKEIELPPAGICEGDCFEPRAVVGNYPQQYKWFFPGGNPDSSISINPSSVCYAHAGTYPVKLIVDNPGGRDSMTSYIVVHPKPVPRFKDSSVVVSYKNQIILPACADATNVSWYKDGMLVCANCLSITIEAQNYLSNYVCVVSNGNCKDSCTYKMRVIDIPHDVWLPDAFTPNGDGHNDVFRIITDNPNVYGVDLYVYNRWGAQLHISHGKDDGWNGAVNGKQADMGTYVWMLRYKVLGSDEVFFKKGDIQLIR